MAPPNYVKIFVCKIFADIKTNWHPSMSRSKIWFLWGPFEGVPDGVAPPNYSTSKYLSVKYLLISKKSSTLAWAIQKIDFWGPILGGFPVELTKKFREKKLRLQLNNFIQKLNFHVCGLGEERTKFREKKRKGKKKKKTSSRPKVGWLGWKGILRQITLWNIFCRT